jgi:N-acetylglucosaminyldiphosphoundecaprenol N-acetyl-beta-D-mannosaminyltransferase
VSSTGFARKFKIGPIGVSRTTYADATASIVAAAKEERRALVAATSAHGLTLAEHDPAFAAMLNQFELVTPDGMPVRWALNLLHGAGLEDRVYGPNLTLSVCQAAAEAGVPIYLYGSKPEVLEQLVARLPEKAPGLRIAGYKSPPFRPLTPEEDAADVADIVGSGAKMVFIGLGCPRQERWAFEHRERLPMPPGAGMDAAGRPRVAVPPGHRAAAALAPLRAPRPGHGLADRARVRPQLSLNVASTPGHRARRTI